jgi:acetyl-CoA/propionyl-CoA carboxylase, biotin carboxylase, biotin carboxyl carrier protein
MFSTVLIANRGEIACRIADACRAIDVRSVAVHSAEDAGARHVRVADASVELQTNSSGRTPYLDVEAFLEAAAVVGADAVHPGYGFLAENADFARAVVGAGLVWVGPPAEVIERLGDKELARAAAEAAGLPDGPGSGGAIWAAADVLRLADQAGWPIVVKAAHGGGGRGMRVIAGPGDVETALDAAAREATSAFGDATLLAERYLSGGRHVEVQVIADTHGHTVAVGTRDCSVQRRHQKLVEEAPASVPSDLNDRLATQAETLLRDVGYIGAGTVEFLVAEAGHYFLEVNTRIQVEHPVTEVVSGVDLVVEQLRIAAGEHLSIKGRPRPRGHAIEVRVNAEDPFRGFVPASGMLALVDFGSSPALRLDTGYESGDKVPSRFDSLLAKVVVHGSDRAQARRAARHVLRGVRIEGLPTTIPAALAVIGHDDFVADRHDTQWFETAIEPGLATTDPVDEDRSLVHFGRTTVQIVHPRSSHLLRPVRADRRSTDHGAAYDRSGVVVSPMVGTVLEVAVKEGERVDEGQPLATIEAMKMENVVRAPVAGRVRAVHVSAMTEVRPGSALVSIEAELEG